MTLIKKPLALVGALLSLLAPVALAEVDPEVAKTIKARLQAGNPMSSYGDVRESPIKGLYEVVDGNNNSLFVTADGSHFIFGDLFEVDSGGRFANLSEARRAIHRSEALGAQSVEDMIVFSPKGKTKARIYVFTDVDCGYCRKLHQDMPELNRRGIEVRYLAFPRTGLQSLGYRKLATAWCSEDSNKTLTALKNRENVPLNVCKDNPVAAHFKLGNETFGVRGTPTIVLEDGRVAPGYLPPATLVKELGI